jgi:mannosyltransferase OCH1-like enzyme
MKLFQYWDTGEPPDDVAACIRSVREMNPEFEYARFDRDSAAWFIGKRLGEREQAAFLALAVPAMQADYFRLCAVWAKGGVWVDADTRAIQPIRSLLDQIDQGLLSMWNGWLQTHVIISPEAHNPFLRATLELVTRNVERRLHHTAYHVTGPMALNLIWCAVDPAGDHAVEHLRRNPHARATTEAAEIAALHPGAADAIARTSRLHDWQTYQWLKEDETTAYKATPADWRNWQGAIYLPE